MKLNWLKNISGAVLTLSMIGAGGAIAQEEPNYSDWDSNGDGALNYEEWNAGFDNEGAFESWDSDGDGSITNDEFGEGVYNSYDSDDSGAIEEPEFGDYGDDVGDGGFWDV